MANGKSQRLPLPAELAAFNNLSTLGMRNDFGSDFTDGSDPAVVSVPTSIDQFSGLIHAEPRCRIIR